MLIVILEAIYLHQVSLRIRVISESPNTLMWCKYICKTARQESLNIVHQVQIWDQHEELHCIQALIYCTTTTIFKAPQLWNWPGVLYDTAHITMHGLDSQVINYMMVPYKTNTTVQSMGHLVPVSKLEVLVTLIRAYNLGPVLPWLKTSKLEIDWATGQLTPPTTQWGQWEGCWSEMIVQWYEGWDYRISNIWRL